MDWLEISEDTRASERRYIYISCGSYWLKISQRFYDYPDIGKVTCVVHIRVSGSLG